MIIAHSPSATRRHAVRHNSGFPVRSALRALGRHNSLPTTQATTNRAVATKQNEISMKIRICRVCAAERLTAAGIMPVRVNNNGCVAQSPAAPGTTIPGCATHGTSPARRDTDVPGTSAAVLADSIHTVILPILGDCVAAQWRRLPRADAGPREAPVTLDSLPCPSGQAPPQPRCLHSGPSYGQRQALS
jgi:hypothetical protein